MICPGCKADNLPGADFCESCGHDLLHLDLPVGANEFTTHLLSDVLGDLGAEQAHVVAPADPVAWAIHVMQQVQAECVLVSQEGRLVGILTAQDILLKAAGGKVDLNAIAVQEIMTPDPVVLREEDTLAVALHKMSIGGFRHIPLVRGARATRVVSIQDVFRHVSGFIREQAAPAQ